MVNYETVGAVLGGVAGGMGMTWGILRFIIDAALDRFELRRLNSKYVTRTLCDARRGTDCEPKEHKHGAD